MDKKLAMPNTNPIKNVSQNRIFSPLRVGSKTVENEPPLVLKGKWQYIFLFPRLKEHLKPYRKLFYRFFISCLLLQIF
jgi:hypothetical protein